MWWSGGCRECGGQRGLAQSSCSACSAHKYDLDRLRNLKKCGAGAPERLLHQKNAMLQPPAAQPRRRQWRCRERALLVALLVLLAHTADAATDTASLPHVDDCGFCASCVVDTSVPEGMPLPIDPATAATTTPQLLKRQQLLTVPSSGATSPSVAAQRRALTQERWAGAAASGSNQLRRAGVSSARTQTSTSSSSSFSSSFSSSRRRRRAPDGTRRSQPTNLGHLFATAAASHPSSSTTTTTRLESGRGSFESWPPAIPRITEAGQLGPEGEVARLALRPMGRLARRAPLLPNCTACRGCNARLQDISSQGEHTHHGPIHASHSFVMWRATAALHPRCGGCVRRLRAVLEFAPRVRFMHRQGDSATWTMFAFPHTSNRRYVVKVRAPASLHLTRALLPRAGAPVPRLHASTPAPPPQVFCVPLRKADALGQGLGAGSLLGQQLPRATGTAAAGGGGGGGGAGVPQAPGAPPPRCGLRTYEARVRSLLAQQQVMGMCGAADLSPKVRRGCGALCLSACACVCARVLHRRNGRTARGTRVRGGAGAIRTAPIRAARR